MADGKTECYWVEIRPGVRRVGNPVLVPLDEVGRFHGFRSVFAYPEVVAELIREEGSTANLRGQPVYADTLFVDFDRSDGSLLIAYLQDKGIAYQQWHSGGRSIHLHIPLVPIEGAWVPHSCKAWVKQHAPDADLSIYHAAGQFRLGGSYHVKNPGARKTLLHAQQGEPLVITPAPVTRVPRFWTGSTESSPEEFYAMLLQPAQTGQRRPQLWRMAVTGFEAGLEYDEIVSSLQWWNQRMTDVPHPDDVVVRQVDSALDQLTRRR